MNRTALLLTVLSLALAAPALAEKPRGDEPSAEDHAAAMQRVRIVRAAALTEALELDEATAARLFPYLREHDEAMEAIHDRKRAARQALRAMVKDDSFKDAEVDRLLAVIADADVELAQARADQLGGLKRVLSTEQRVKFVMVQGRLDQEVRRVIREERIRHRGGDGGERRDRRERRARDYSSQGE